MIFPFPHYQGGKNILTLDIQRKMEKLIFEDIPCVIIIFSPHKVFVVAHYIAHLFSKLSYMAQDRF